MTASWTDWQRGTWNCTTTTPYVHWWEQSEAHARGVTGGSQMPGARIATLPDFPQEMSCAVQAFTVSKYAAMGKSGFDDWRRDLTAQDRAMFRTVAQNFTTQVRMPLPDTVLNPSFSAETDWLLPSLDAYPEPPDPAAAITGIIDTGIALGHRRFREASGRSRILAAWQQGALRLDDAALGALDPDAAEAARRQQDLLPFGRELLAGDIDALLARHALGGDPFALDEDAFWRAAGLVDMTTATGHRELMAQAAHGTQVLDLAAGRDPGTDPEATRSKAPIIAVNLPSRGPVGLSGAFLEYFVIHAIYRIVGLADLLWLRHRLESGTPCFGDRVEGYPIVINFAFGKQADARDGGALFARIVDRLNRDRASTTDRCGARKPVQSRVHFVVPAGNDNLLRGNAVMELAPGATRKIGWRVLPEDRTANFVEVISDVLPGGVPEPEGEPLGLELGALPPPCAAGGVDDTPSAGRRGTCRSLGAAARIYCDALPVNGAEESDQHRVRYTLCAAPTWAVEPCIATAPAGLWWLTVRNPTDRQQTVTLNIQTDQSLLPNSRSGLRSYFDDPTYRHVDPTTGRWLDTYSYSEAATAGIGAGAVLLDRADLVRRTGTLSALAHAPGVVVVGSHCASDGRPADYAGTGLHDSGDGVMPTVSLPSDHSPFARGTMTSGSRDGSASAPRGTSFAAALATRMAAEMLRGHPGHEFDLQAAFMDRVPQAAPPAYGAVRPAKTGAGRIAAPATGRAARN